MLIIYVAGLMAALYWVFKTLAPEMAQPSLIKSAPNAKVPQSSPNNQPDNRIEKLEILLLEKNKNIQLLQTELRSFHTQLRNFDKIKILQEEEIHRLKEQNRIFRSELGLPTAHLKENSIT